MDRKVVSAQELNVLEAMAQKSLEFIKERQK